MKILVVLVAAVVGCLVCYDLGKEHGASGRDFEKKYYNEYSRLKSEMMQSYVDFSAAVDKEFGSACGMDRNNIIGGMTVYKDIYIRIYDHYGVKTIRGDSCPENSLPAKP